MISDRFILAHGFQKIKYYFRKISSFFNKISVHGIPFSADVAVSEQEEQQQELINQQEENLLEMAKANLTDEPETEVIVSVEEEEQLPYKDSLLNKAYHYNRNYEIAAKQHTISNDVVSIVLHSLLL